MKKKIDNFVCYVKKLNVIIDDSDFKIFCNSCASTSLNIQILIIF